MTHDVSIQPSPVLTTITQGELPALYWAGRLGTHALVYRTTRSQLGGGFGDQYKYPYAWAVIVYVDGQAMRVISARGADREWTSLDRLERWLREMGFRTWWLRNDLEPTGVASEPEPCGPGFK